MWLTVKVLIRQRIISKGSQSMRKAIAIAAVVAAGCAATISSIPADAQARRRGAAVHEIRIPRGDNCYFVTGNHQRWGGTFGRNQRVEATSYSVPNSSPPEIDRMVFVSGPNGFSAAQRLGATSLVFVTGAAGRYTFSFGPNALRGGRGQFEVCTL